MRAGTRHSHPGDIGGGGDVGDIGGVGGGGGAGQSGVGRLADPGGTGTPAGDGTARPHPLTKRSPGQSGFGHQFSCWC